MSDAHPDCIHGAAWSECEECKWEQNQLDDQATDDDFFDPA